MSDHTLSEIELLQHVTAVTRKADDLHKKVGGGTRHWVRECFLECLDDAGLMIVKQGRVRDLETRLAETQAERDHVELQRTKALEDLRLALDQGEEARLARDAWRAEVMRAWEALDGEYDDQAGALAEAIRGELE